MKLRGCLGVLRWGLTQLSSQGSLPGGSDEPWKGGEGASGKLPMTLPLFLHDRQLLGTCFLLRGISHLSGLCLHLSGTL